MACDYTALTATKVEWMRLTRPQLRTMKLVLLCAINNFYESGTAMPACDVDSLMAEAGILNRLTEYQKQVLEVILLCNIAGYIESGGGGGGSGANFLSGHGDPEGVTTGTRVGQSYLDLDTGNTHWFAGTVTQNTGWIP